MSCHKLNSCGVQAPVQYTGHIYCDFEVISPVTRHNFRGVVYASIIVFLRKAFREFVIACYLDIILYIMFLRLAAC